MSFVHHHEAVRGDDVSHLEAPDLPSRLDTQAADDRVVHSSPVRSTALFSTSYCSLRSDLPVWPPKMSAASPALSLVFRMLKYWSEGMIW
jgi:hypothetical protein